MNNTNNIGIKEQLQQATTMQELDSILAKAHTFKHAHPSTQRKWVKIASKKHVEINSKN